MTIEQEAKELFESYQSVILENYRDEYIDMFRFTLLSTIKKCCELHCNQMISYVLVCFDKNYPDYSKWTKIRSEIFKIKDLTH